MLRDVFYYGDKPNVHPREQYAESFDDARQKSTTEHFWIINEFCDYTGFDWDFDFEFLPDEDVWAENHCNIWPSQHQKDSGTWLCSSEQYDLNLLIYRNDVTPVKRKNIKTSNWVELDLIDPMKFDFSWHPDPTDPPYIYKWGSKYAPVQFKTCLEYHVEGAIDVKYMTSIVELLPEWDRWEQVQDVDKSKFDFSWRPDPREPALIHQFGTQWQKTGGPRYVVEGATNIKYTNEQRYKRPSDYSNWTIPSNIDTNGFDFSWHPDDTSPPYIYVFATQWAFSGGPVYTVNGATEIKYIDDQVATAKIDKTNWQYDPNLIDEDNFDFSWHPYVEDEPYIYVFGTQWQKTGGPVYVAPGSHANSPVKYVDARIIEAIRLPSKNNWAVLDNLIIKDFDFSWHPDETEDPYIYVFGNNQYPAEIMPTIEYRVEGATQIKYVSDIVATLDVDMTNWFIPDNIDDTTFDYSWKPNPKDPPYMYEFATQWQKTGGPRYIMEEATEVKYIDTMKVKALPDINRFTVLDNNVIADFDFSWHPDSTEEPYIYVFGNNQYPAEIMPTIEYRVENATTVKYINDIVANLGINMSNWVVPDNIDDSMFDYSWKPNPKDPVFNYEFGTQWQKTGGPRYVVSGATDIKYIEGKTVTRLVSTMNWQVLDNLAIKDFDYSWHPDSTEEPYIYVFGNNQYPAEVMHTIEYRVKNATVIKYVSDIVATLDVDMDNWIVPDNIDDSMFDYSWKPNPKDPPYMYEFATQWQKTGGPRYVVEGATERKFIDDQKVIRKLSISNWTVPDNIDATEFDFSWHPDDTSPPYIYVFATQWALSGGPAYTVDGAIETKYVDDQVASAIVDKTNWQYDPTLVEEDSFDFSWHPYAEDQPYIYKFGTQWQKSGGPVYVAPGSHANSPVKYIDTRIIKSNRLPSKSNWHIVDDLIIKDFDYSWHPDETEEPYIYVFGNTQYPAEIMPTIEYRVDGATQYKYISDIVAVLDIDMHSWFVPDNIDDTNFDYSWKPNPKDPPYIYEFATQWQKTGGPRYVVEGAVERKFIDDQKVIRKISNSNWTVPDNIDIAGFDFSWHHDDTDPPYIYVFATQWAFSGGPVYTVDGAIETKYIDDQTAIAKADKTNWQYDPNVIDENSFDFSWHPYAEDQPYIYKFGTQWQKTGGPTYVTPGCHANSPIKYVDTRIIKSKRLPGDKTWFSVLNNMPVKDFDYSWHPDETEEPYIYVFGNQWYPAEVMPTVEYKVPGATTIKYVSDTIAILAPNMDNWIVPDSIDASKFDFSWRPEPKSPELIFEFATQWQKTGGPRYVMPNAVDIKYMDIIKATRLADKTNWHSLVNIDERKFDYSWHPDATAEPYVYTFGNTLYPVEEMPTIEYRVEGATQLKYVNDIVATLAVDMTNWVVPTNVDDTEFDYTWKPNPTDPPYIYEFGTQWQKTGGPRYVVEDATEVKYMSSSKVRHLPDPSKFKVLDNYLIKSFDFSWHPDDTAPPYKYQFGSNWYPVEEMPVIEYTLPNATQVTFISDIKASLAKDMTNWEIPDGIDVATFDFAWVPHPAAIPYIYQFGTRLDKADGPKYITPNTTGETIYVPRLEVSEEDTDVVMNKHLDINKYYIVTTLEDLINQHPDEVFWAMRKEIDYSSFEFDWRPSITQVQYVHVFGSSASTKSQTYLVNSAWWNQGLQEFNFVEVQEVETVEKLDMFYVDKGNVEAQARFEAIKSMYPQIQKTRYLNSWVDTVKRCTNRATSNLIWVLNSELDYSNFDFDYYPNPWQMKMVHVFGTQWSHWGSTFLVNRETFAEDTKYINIIEHLSNLNFVKNIRAKATQCVYDTIIIDHGNKELDSVVQQVTAKTSGKNITVVKYNNSYLQTLKDIVARSQEKKEHYLWLCSSVCDYSSFDFSYVCDPFARDNLHVFASGKQKFGDTFFIDVNKTREIIDDMELLEDYHKVNYNGTLNAARLPEPIVVTNNDTLIDIAINIEGFPYATIITSDNKDISVIPAEPMNLWAPETKNILVTSTGATRITVPREVKDHVQKELYDYPYIKKASKLAISTPMDIVYLSNGETGAEENWEHLQKITKGLKNRVVRVDGVNGRVQAYHAALEASETPWAFTVFAKLKISPKFDFNWQPDRMQAAKHYIFHAKNPVNGLIYGHQAMIAYNKRLTLANKGNGLDFTLDDEHEVVPLLSGTANYNTDEFSTWRTSFREVLKLKAEDSDIARTRLDAWLNKAEGDFSQYSIKGAIDADEYYDEVDGDFDMLKLSYEWAWLKEKFANL